MARSLACLLSAAALVALAGGAAAAQDIRDVGPEDIAREVRTEFDVRSGREVHIAPSFDPFSDDETLAGTLSLRSADTARDLDGRVLSGGAVLDLELYFSRSGEPAFGRTRDALFLSGEPVPIVSRDSRDLECSSRVTETVYLADRYYGGYSGYRGLTRLRPGYLFGGGYADPYRYGDAGYGHYGYGHGYGYGHPGYHGGYVPVTPRRRRPPRRRVGHGHDETPQPPRTTYDPDRYAPIDDSGQGRPALGRDYIRDSVPDKTGSRTDRRRPRTTRTDRDRAAPVAPAPRTPPRDPRLVGTPDRRPAVTAPRSRPAASAPSPSPRPRPAPPAPRPSKPAASSPPVSRPRPTPAPRPAPSKPKASSGRRDPSRPSRSDLKGPRLFPNGYGDVAVVSASRDCAVEDRLSLFIPEERLEAARFDGLTIWVRDVEPGPDSTLSIYDERAVFIPPNYIEGFRRAQRR